MRLHSQAQVNGGFILGVDEMKKGYKPITWKVKYFDCNEQLIKDYDVLKNNESQIRNLKKKCLEKIEFAKELRREFMYHYWSKCEWEMIIKITDDNKIVLTPWAGCRDEDKASIDVTDDNSFDWRRFAEYHIGNQVFKNRAKIDVYDQLMWRWDELVSYLWTTKLPYERRNSKFDK